MVASKFYDFDCSKDIYRASYKFKYHYNISLSPVLSTLFSGVVADDKLLVPMQNF